MAERCCRNYINIIYIYLCVLACARVCVYYDSVIIIISLFFLLPTDSMYVRKAIFFSFSRLIHYTPSWMPLTHHRRDCHRSRPYAYAPNRTNDIVICHTSPFHILTSTQYVRVKLKKKLKYILQKLQTAINLSIYICHVELNSC